MSRQTSTYANTYLAHGRCNLVKGAKIVDEKDTPSYERAVAQAGSHI